MIAEVVERYLYVGSEVGLLWRRWRQREHSRNHEDIMLGDACTL